MISIESENRRQPQDISTLKRGQFFMFTDEDPAIYCFDCIALNHVDALHNTVIAIQYSPGALEIPIVTNLSLKQDVVVLNNIYVNVEITIMND